MTAEMVLDILGVGGLALIGVGVYLEFGLGWSLIVVGALCIGTALVVVGRK